MAAPPIASERLGHSRVATAAVLALPMTPSALGRITLSAILLVGASFRWLARRGALRLRLRDPTCPAIAQRDLFSPDALQCWFTAPHGRWRRLDHQSHLEALVVFIEARDLRDAETIGRLLVEDAGRQALLRDSRVCACRETRRHLARTTWCAGRAMVGSRRWTFDPWRTRRSPCPLRELTGARTPPPYRWRRPPRTACRSCPDR